MKGSRYANPPRNSSSRAVMVRQRPFTLASVFSTELCGSCVGASASKQAIPSDLHLAGPSYPMVPMVLDESGSESH